MTAYHPGLLHAYDGTQVATYTWLPDNGRPRALVQIAHGAAEHALRYDRFAQHLVAKGYGVLATDHRGHGATAQYTGGYGVAGASGAQRDGGGEGGEEPEAAGTGAAGIGAGGDGDGWRAIVDDLRIAGDQARTLHPGVPVVLLGHSMGSMLARDYAQEFPDGLAGLILTGTFRTLPGAEIEGSIERLERECAEAGRAAISSYVSELFASFNDQFPYRTGFEWLSRDESHVDAYVADERCGFPFSAGLSLDWLRAIRKINDPRNLARIPADLPVHVAVGENDPCNALMTLVYELLEDFRYVGTEDLTWKSYPGARHEIFNETNRIGVQEDLTGWLDQHV